MLEARLSSHWRMELEVLSPLHVGAGGPRLLHDYDFVTHQGAVWVIDLDRALERLSDADLAAGVDARLTAVLRPGEYAACVRYRLRLTGGSPGEIIPCIRDVDDRPYLPGSSLKGALRTALAWAMIAGGDRRLDLDTLVPSPKYAAARLERSLFGPNPNNDLLRGLHVGDATPAAGVEPELAVAAVYTLRATRLVAKGQGYRWYVEALPAGTRLIGDFSLDEHLFGPQAQALPFNRRRSWLADLPRHSLAFARELIRQEARFYADAGLPAPADFYRRLSATAERAGPGEGLVQLGWGAGWTAKTLGLLIRESNRLPEIVQRYRLDRGRGADVFPKTRRLIERAERAAEPPGWVRFRLQPREE